jgi:hypothetical protein
MIITIPKIKANIKDIKFINNPPFTVNPVITGYIKQNKIIKQINNEVNVIFLSF